MENTALCAQQPVQMLGEIQLRLLSWPMPSLRLQYPFVLTLSNVIGKQNNFVEFLTSIISPFHVPLIFSAEDGFFLFHSQQSKTQSTGVNSSLVTLAIFLCCSKHCQCTVQTYIYLCSYMPTHSSRHVYVSIWVHTERNNSNIVHYVFL